MVDIDGQRHQGTSILSMLGLGVYRLRLEPKGEPKGIGGYSEKNSVNPDTLFTVMTSHSRTFIFLCSQFNRARAILLFDEV